MSFEGYNEYRCRHGHTASYDVYDSEPTACPDCGCRWVARRMIDETNETDIGPWWQIEYRPQFGDYVRAGYGRS